MADSHGIHLVRSPQVSPKPQPLDPADIAAAVLETVRESNQALNELRDWQELLIRQMAAQLDQLEVTALRSIAPKVGRS